jgi:hypothetical protein
MAVTPSNAPQTVHITTIEGARLGVARVRHPTSGVQCLAFTTMEGRRLALVPRDTISDLRQRLWQLSAVDGNSYTLGPIDIAVVRKLAA